VHIIGSSQHEKPQKSAAFDVEELNRDLLSWESL
jgi:hypothetical protein